MILRNLSREPHAFDLPALGTDIHTGGVSTLDPQSGARQFTPHERELPKSLSLSAGNPRVPLAAALADGSAVSGLPDSAADDPTVKRLVSQGVLTILKETT